MLYPFNSKPHLILFQTTHYRFSLSWARIFTDGTASTFNQAGIDFYNKFIDALVAAGIQPVVTLYHWDLPQHLQDIGGWPNEELVGHFENYARTCYKAFADRVFKIFLMSLILEVLLFLWLLHVFCMSFSWKKNSSLTIFKLYLYYQGGSIW